jgi:glycine cleavage system H protein
VNPQELLFADTHEWALIQDKNGQKVATVGISAFAVEQMTDLVFLSLPEVGRQVTAGESMGEIESVKAVSDLYSPVTGEVVEVNTKLPDTLETMSKDPYGDGWIARIRISDETTLQKLMNYDRYQAQCAAEG